ncbi:amidohydrolase family protein [Paucibacter sp. R3-3]|uniref:Amidohydrolase family protein n=1 Tax=Roseateles agri TaxID=3098619 RepID=A0ABU5DNJ9_9BURK|nr:amidohydrolase family protein [Paucibacter sp. R3-3]MDY0747895.1 amidohydrolase family protein [Paucibacter sp. R3-3]
MQRIDAHQHFWRLDRGDYGWLTAELAPLYRDFAPGDLQPLLQRHGVAQTVLVQAADSTAETDFMLELAASHDWIGGVVGWVDISDRASIATLERWAREHPKFKGVRPMLQDLPEDDWIATRPHADVMACIAALGLRLDALVLPRQLEPLLHFVRRHPTLPVVIDHAAKPRLDEGWSAVWAHAWRRDMAALAAHPNLMCKFSGLLTETRSSEPLPLIRPAWEDLLRWFGPQRLVWGSDWPVLNLAADYGRWVALSDSLLGDLNAADQQRVLHDNAREFYTL